MFPALDWIEERRTQGCLPSCGQVAGEASRRKVKPPLQLSTARLPTTGYREAAGKLPGSSPLVMPTGPRPRHRAVEPDFLLAWIVAAGACGDDGLQTC